MCATDQRATLTPTRYSTHTEAPPRPQPLSTLLRGERLVVGADPGRSVGVQRLPEQPGRVAVDVDVDRERELLQLALVAGDDAGEVHHLGQAEHPLSPQQAVEVARAERPSRRLEVRGRDGRGGHEVEVERQAVARVE